MRVSENDIVRLFWECGSYYSLGQNIEQIFLTKSRIVADEWTLTGPFQSARDRFRGYSFLVAGRLDEDYNSPSVTFLS
jgi:hypothetical protein